MTSISEKINIFVTSNLIRKNITTTWTSQNVFLLSTWARQAAGQ